MARLKMDGRNGALRYVDRRGKARSQGGRLSYLYGRVFADALLTGWGHDFEIRVAGGAWHRLTDTPEEVAAMLASHPLSRRRLARLAKRSDYVLRAEETS